MRLGEPVLVTEGSLALRQALNNSLVLNNCSKSTPSARICPQLLTNCSFLHVTCYLECLFPCFLVFVWSWWLLRICLKWLLYYFGQQSRDCILHCKWATFIDFSDKFFKKIQHYVTFLLRFSSLGDLALEGVNRS